MLKSFIVAVFFWISGREISYLHTHSSTSLEMETIFFKQQNKEKHAREAFENSEMILCDVLG